MALICCSECGNSVSDKAPVCPRCGIKIATELHNPAETIKDPGTVSRPKAVLILGTVAIALAIIFVAFVNNDPNVRARGKDRDAIEYCRSEYARVSKDPRTTRSALGMAYGACEQAEKDYRDKWGRKP